MVTMVVVNACEARFFVHYVTWLVVELTHLLKNMLVKIGSFPQVGVKIKKKIETTTYSSIPWAPQNLHFRGFLMVKNLVLKVAKTSIFRGLMVFYD